MKHLWWVPIFVLLNLSILWAYLAKKDSLQAALEEQDVARIISKVHESGFKVYPTSGKLYYDGEQFTPILFLFIRDSSDDYRAVYFKTEAGRMVLVIILPGAVRDLGLERILK